MKKIKIIALIILTIIVMYEIHALFFKRTPEKLLKLQFNICLKNFDYSVEAFEEKWCPNGDGYVFIIYKFNELTQKNIDYLERFELKPLPISKVDGRLMFFDKVPKKYLDVDSGYYLYEPLSEHYHTDYKIFIIDVEQKIAILYYQYM